MPSGTEPRRPPRRAVDFDRRTRTADETREKILAAAIAEFGAKGYAGARTAGIAERAGVNQQLIAYHFGGKQGVLDELRRRWAAEQEDLTDPGTSFEATLRGYLDQTLDRPDWARLVVWRGLGDGVDRDEEYDDTQRQRVRSGVDRIRERQRTGELSDAVDAEFVMLLAQLIVFAPVALPERVRDILDLEPGSPEYRELCLRQLMTLLKPIRET